MQHPLFHAVHEECGIWHQNGCINCIRCAILSLSRHSFQSFHNVPYWQIIMLHIAHLTMTLKGCLELRILIECVPCDSP